MERTDMEKAVQELRELRRMADELAHEIEGCRTESKPRWTPRAWRRSAAQIGK